MSHFIPCSKVACSLPYILTGFADGCRGALLMIFIRNCYCAHVSSCTAWGFKVWLRYEISTPFKYLLSPASVASIGQVRSDLGLLYHGPQSLHLSFSCKVSKSSRHDGVRSSAASVGLCHRDPDALQLLIKMYVERAHSLWKVPEVFWVSMRVSVCMNLIIQQQLDRVRFCKMLTVMFYFFA